MYHIQCSYTLHHLWPAFICVHCMLKSAWRNTFDARVKRFGVSKLAKAARLHLFDQVSIKDFEDFLIIIAYFA